MYGVFPAASKPTITTFASFSRKLSSSFEMYTPIYSSKAFYVLYRYKPYFCESVAVKCSVDVCGTTLGYIALLQLQQQ